VIRNIAEEIKRAKGELKSLEQIVELDKAVCLALDRIRYLEDVIRDGGGWKNDSQWWNESSSWSRNVESSLRARRKSVYYYTTSTDADGNTTRTRHFDYYKYKTKIKDSAAIAKAIQDQWDRIATLDGDIAREQRNINDFLENEERVVVGEKNTEDNSGWYDGELEEAAERIAGIIEVWEVRKGQEEDLIEENKLVHARFVELMNEALVPIADYYRIQQRILEDQQNGLNAAQGVMDAIHGGDD